MRWIVDYLLCNHTTSDYTRLVAARTKGKQGGWRPGAGRKPTLRDPVSFTLHVERADVETLEAIAEERGVSVASVMRTALSAYVKRSKRR